jgi:hypothetical protein
MGVILEEAEDFVDAIRAIAREHARSLAVFGSHVYRLAALHGYMARRADAQLDACARNPDDFDFDILAEDDGFADASAQD